MNDELYLLVLEEHMLNFYHIHGSEVFMHDIAPCHKTRTEKITRLHEQKQISTSGMAWQQSGFKSDWKLLAQNEKKDVQKENTQPRDFARRAQKCGARRCQRNIL